MHNNAELTDGFYRRFLMVEADCFYVLHGSFSVNMNGGAAVQLTMKADGCAFSNGR